MEELNYENNKKLTILIYFCLSLGFISSITNMIISILNNDYSVGRIITIIILSVFSLFLILMGLFFKDKKIRIFCVIFSILITLFSISSIIISLVNIDRVPNFVGRDIKEVISWANERDIIVNQKYEFSDDISKYQVISQDIKEKTNTKKIKSISVLVSDGIDESIKTEVDNMIGWKLDDVIKYIDDNHLTNVNILFEYNSEVDKDTIFYQDVIKEIKRNEPITLKSSLGREGNLKNITMKKLVGMDLFHALVYLGRNNLDYEIIYTYSEEDEDIVLKQNVNEWKVIERDNYSPIIINVSKKNKITVVDLSKYDVAKINTWATSNRIKVNYKYEFSDTIKKDKVISYTPKMGNIISVDDTIYITLSKGTLNMIKFTTIEDFTTWANDNDVNYTVDYEYSDTVSKGKVISISHKENDVVKSNDTIKIILSQGGNTTIPNLIGMDKDEASDACKKANIKCNFIGDGKVIKQSMKAGSNVPSDTTINLTLEDK